MALLSEEFFSPEDRLSLLALGALSEVSDEGVVLPMNGNKTVHLKKTENPHNTTICELESPPPFFEIYRVSWLFADTVWLCKVTALGRRDSI